jgi:hypothetical protein
VVRFLGAGLDVRADDATGAFAARTASLAGAVIHARRFVEARLPDGDVVTGDAVLGQLVRDGRGLPIGPAGSTRLLVEPGTYRIRVPGGTEPRRLAMGAFASGGALGSLCRPGTNGAFFRDNDRVARWILHQAGCPVHEPDGVTAR